MWRRSSERVHRPPPRAADWRSYDSVADEYARVRAPVHEGPVRDLVALVGPPAGARVLDVGTGTGLGAHAAAELVGPDGVVVGLDPSMGMLEVARRNGLDRVVAAQALDLPFRDGTFDAVLAAFVVLFFRSYETGLHEMVRILRRGGRMGVTTWGRSDDEFRRAWRAVAE